MDLSISFSLCAVMDLPIYKKWVVLDLSISFFVGSDGPFHQFFVGSDGSFHQFFSVCSDGPFHI